MLGSPASRRVYEYAIDQFIAWYCSEPRLAFNRIVVVRYRMYLESRGLITKEFVLFDVITRVSEWQTALVSYFFRANNSLRPRSEPAMTCSTHPSEAICCTSG